MITTSLIKIILKISGSFFPARQSGTFSRMSCFLLSDKSPQSIALISLCHQYTYWSYKILLPLQMLNCKGAINSSAAMPNTKHMFVVFWKWLLIFHEWWATMMYTFKTIFWIHIIKSNLFLTPFSGCEIVEFLVL